MNRKQKVLTAIALIAFVVIGVGHYVATKAYDDYSKGRTVERTVFPTPAPDFNVEAYLAGVTPSPTPTATPAPVKEQVPDPDIRWYLGWVEPRDSIIPDVRMPWFMLGVIYVGLFFLLADRKEKR